MIKNIIFDLGGVIMTLDHPEAVRRFKALGLADAEQQLDAYTQTGIFGDLEHGKITAEDFMREISKQVGHEVSYEACRHAWLGYCKEVPARNLQLLQELRSKGYRVILLSNTNPFMMQWANRDFDGQGHSIGYFFDALYLSYECKVMKPRREIFDIMLRGQQSQPGETLFIDDGPRNVEVAAAMGMHTLCPHNNEDWIAPLHALLAKG
jgi:putative hydrolase of the HAD superfamily